MLCNMNSSHYTVALVLMDAFVLLVARVVRSSLDGAGSRHMAISMLVHALLALIAVTNGNYIISPGKRVSMATVGRVLDALISTEESMGVNGLEDRGKMERSAVVKRRVVQR